VSPAECAGGCLSALLAFLRLQVPLHSLQEYGALPQALPGSVTCYAVQPLNVFTTSPKELAVHVVPVRLAQPDSSVKCKETHSRWLNGIECMPHGRHEEEEEA
jgi:hypothetical protein